jgi:hypothetical protein
MVVMVVRTKIAHIGGGGSVIWGNNMGREIRYFETRRSVIAIGFKDESRGVSPAVSDVGG